MKCVGSVRGRACLMKCVGSVRGGACLSTLSRALWASLSSGAATSAVARMLAASSSTYPRLGEGFKRGSDREGALADVSSTDPTAPAQA